MNQIASQMAGYAGGLFFGSAPWQDHHGGALLVKDEQGWFLIKNLVGMEWSSQFCSDPAKVDKALPGPRVGEPQVAVLEKAIDTHESQLVPLKSFILPGGTAKAAALHFARTVCRRAERAVVALAHGAAVSPAILQYLNRLSDLLFVLARAANAQASRPDTKW